MGEEWLPPLESYPMEVQDRISTGFRPLPRMQVRHVEGASVDAWCVLYVVWGCVWGGGALCFVWWAFVCALCMCALSGISSPPSPPS